MISSSSSSLVVPASDAPQAEAGMPASHSNRCISEFYHIGSAARGLRAADPSKQTNDMQIHYGEALSTYESCVRFFFPVPFFFGRTTLTGSGVPVRTTSSRGASYCGKEVRGMVGVTERCGVCGSGMADGVRGRAPCGISPSLSITNCSEEKF